MSSLQTIRNRFCRTIALLMCAPLLVPSFMVVCICPSNDVVLASRFHAGPACGNHEHELLHVEHGHGHHHGHHHDHESLGCHEHQHDDYEHHSHHQNCQTECDDVSPLNGQFVRHDRFDSDDTLNIATCISASVCQSIDRPTVGHTVPAVADVGLPPPDLLRTVVLQL